MNNAAIFIQARTGSRRLPKKVLKKISKNSLIEWVLKRIKKTKKIKKIVLVTSTNKKDNILEKITKKNKVLIYRGKNNDVLDRFYQGAKKFKANIIIRICADNPFVDATQIDRLFNKFVNSQYDYAFNHQSKLNSQYADGFGAEIFNFDVLKKLKKLKLNKDQKEHVTKYIWDNFKKFKVLAIKPPKKLAYPFLKFDIDTLSDYKIINSLVRKYKISIKTSAAKIIQYKLQELKKNE
jgi:spore coat polysaccharide biosynthesis protein SpsF